MADDSQDVRLPAAAAAAIARGSKIEAIKDVRETTGLGLYEAKQLVERYIDANPVLKSQFEQQEAALKRRVFRWLLVVNALIFVAVMWWFFGR